MYIIWLDYKNTWCAFCFAVVQRWHTFNCGVTMTWKVFGMLTLVVRFPSNYTQFRYNSEMRPTVGVQKKQISNLTYWRWWSEFLTMHIGVMLIGCITFYVFNKIEHLWICKKNLLFLLFALYMFMCVCMHLFMCLCACIFVYIQIF